MSDIENQSDVQWEKQANAWVHAFITATKTARLYGQEHPAIQEALDKIVAISEPIWESYGTVKLEIRAQILRVLNIPTTYYERPQDNPFFPLLLDQIGGLQITNGMQKDELGQFFKILFQPVKEYEENSVGTLLWEANLPHIEIVRLPELLSTAQSENEEEGDAVIDDLIAAALRESVNPDDPVQAWRTTVRLDSLSADQAAELRDLERPTEFTSQFRSLDNQQRIRKRVRDGLLQSADGSSPAFAQAVVSAVADNATISDVLAAREALLTLGIDSLNHDTPTEARQYFDQSTKLLDRVATSQKTAPPEEIASAIGEAFANALHRAEGHLDALEHLWSRLPDKSQETCIRALAIQRSTEPVKAIRAVAKTCKTDTRQMLLYSTYETNPEVAGHMLLFSAGLLGSDANQALGHALQHSNGQIRIVAFRMLARASASHAIVMARKLIFDEEPALRRDARLILKQAKDPTMGKQLPKILKSPEFKAWEDSEKSEVLVWSLHILEPYGSELIGSIAASAGLFATQYDRDVAVLAIRALGMVGGHKEVDVLKRIRKSVTAHPHARKAAKTTLDKLEQG